MARRNDIDGTSGSPADLFPGLETTAALVAALGTEPAPPGLARDVLKRLPRRRRPALVRSPRDCAAIFLSSGILFTILGLVFAHALGGAGDMLPPAWHPVQPLAALASGILLGASGILLIIFDRAALRPAKAAALAHCLLVAANTVMLLACAPSPVLGTALAAYAWAGLTLGLFLLDAARSLNSDRPNDQLPSTPPVPRNRGLAAP